jgi:hypothetical protein
MLTHTTETKITVSSADLLLVVLAETFSKLFSLSDDSDKLTCEGMQRFSNGIVFNYVVKFSSFL